MYPVTVLRGSALLFEHGRAFVFTQTHKSLYRYDMTGYNSIVLHIDQFRRNIGAAKRMEISDHRTR